MAWKKTVMKIPIRLVLNVINNDLKINITEAVLDCAHYSGDTKKKKKKSCSILEKFLR